MPNDLIAAQFVAYKELSYQGNKEVDAILHETPFERAKREIQEQLERNQQYRAVILKNVTTFGELTAGLASCCLSPFDVSCHSWITAELHRDCCQKHGGSIF